MISENQFLDITELKVDDAKGQVVTQVSFHLRIIHYSHRDDESKELL